MKIVIVLAAVLYCAHAATVPPPLVWSDCADDPNNTVLTVQTLNLQPLPITFPGDLYVTMDLTVNRQITKLFIDVELNRTTILGDVPVPCVQNIGTCQKIPACSLLEKIKNGSSIVSQNLGLQIDSILLLALGHNAQCPVNPETVSIVNQPLKLAAIPSSLALLADGDYKIKVSVFEDETSNQNVGCLQFTASIAKPGFLFG